MYRCSLMAGLGWLLLAGSSATATVVTLTAAQDNTLYQDAAGALSNGAGEFFFAGRTANGLIRRGLVRFDVAGLPAGAVINDVSLTLHLSMTSGGAGGGANDVSLHQILNEWGEGTSNAPGGEGGGAPSTIGDATWIHTQFNTALWDSPGGDFDPAAGATTSVNAVGFHAWSSLELTADVQDWLNNPAINFGWLLKGDESLANTSKRFDTCENANASFRPLLTIDYTPVPHPSAIAVVLVGLFMRQRRR